MSDFLVYFYVAVLSLIPFLFLFWWRNHSARLAILYMCLIPLFGMLYSTLPTRFYHATAKYEAYTNDDAKKVMSQGEVWLRAVFKRPEGASVQKAEPKEGIFRFYHSSETKVSKIAADETSVTLEFYIFGGIATLEKGSEGRLLRTSSPLISKGTVLFPLKNENPLLNSGVTSSMSVRVEGDPFFLFKSGDHEKTPDERVENSFSFVSVPKSLEQDVLRYGNSMNGFPPPSSANILRMYYLSAVTVTTLGFGDIVPIDNLSRFLVSLESIAGIVLIGLFLNSLTRPNGEGSRKGELDQSPPNVSATPAPMTDTSTN